MRYDLIFVMAALFARSCWSQSPVPLSNYIPDIGARSAVITMTPTALGIIGPLSKEVLAAVTTHPGLAEVNTVYIDSGGGDLEPSINLARLIRQHNIRLVVAGRCMSACASYVFVGAQNKDILPGSLIAIHGKRFNYYRDDNIVIDVNARHANSLAGLSKDATASSQVAKILQAESRFFDEMQISTSHFLAFARYEGAREAFGTKDTKSCPTVAAWIMTRNDLEHMGVRGIGAAWFPASAKEAVATSQKLGFQPGQVFFGTIDDLAKLCRKDSQRSKQSVVQSSSSR